ncbi:hypothetical protein APHNP_0045 [Anaplasma phagocytophilum str. ApNP]|uniref:Uncharacterized protein n=2 Tax=Anaplasma phagocytophilum TaxID=948 RepID=A0A0F3NHP1_ANAPH|nr:hypothetical protein APHMUC_0289 [Anaplasma phagocytophilum str. ApMUC09]KJV67222.1 hypothetical protein APHNP_0045 [Anaplasma phagocytophilum str. ApNP]KJV98805.1 hypothetical protein OTSANNIE_0871 [Anaplasma phagocytophilum str. Annie]KJZ98236.1 hypothetical protein APHDU1_1417 [Anaplasma phagocytophilum]
MKLRWLVVRILLQCLYRDYIFPENTLCLLFSQICTLL